MKKMTRFFMRTGSGLLTAGGALLLGRGITNPNPVFEKEMADRGAIVLDARKKYGVGQECFSSGAFMVGCSDFVNGNRTRKEKDVILNQFNAEITLRQSQIPVDPEAHKQAERDGLKIFFGLPMVSMGIVGLGLSQEETRRGRQFQNKIERRRGRRKEEM